MTQTKCPYCGTMMENVCPKCMAYRVTEETHDLPLSKQPYYNPEIHKKPKKKKGERILERKDTIQATINPKLEEQPHTYIPPAKGNKRRYLNEQPIPKGINLPGKWIEKK